MRELLLACLLASLSITVLYSMESNSTDDIKSYYINTKKSIDAISKKAQEGDVAYGLALYDFYKNIKDPSHKITYGPSQKVLKSYNLLDKEDQVNHIIRCGFKKFAECSLQDCQDEVRSNIRNNLRKLKIIEENS